jgi:hypothetical protein
LTILTPERSAKLPKRGTNQICSLEPLLKWNHIDLVVAKNLVVGRWREMQVGQM